MIKECIQANQLEANAESFHLVRDLALVQEADAKAHKLQAKLAQAEQRRELAKQATISKAISAQTGPRGAMKGQLKNASDEPELVNMPTPKNAECAQAEEAKLESLK